MRSVLVGLALLLGAGRALGQQGSPPSFFFPDNRAQCREQVARLMMAVNNANADALRQLIYTRPEREAQRLGAGAVINCIVARRKLEQEIARRWGEEAPKALGGTSAFPDRDREAVATAEVQASSTEALLYLSPGTTAIELRRTKSGQWRILLRAVDLLNDDGQRKPEPGSLQRIEYLRGVARALQLVEAQVRGGKIASADAAREALQQALEEAGKPQPEPPAAPADNGNK
jgi:hypothetical protein